MPEITITELDLFRKFFTGNEKAHGRHVYKFNEVGKKESGSNATLKEIVTDQKYRDHLEGKTGLGIIPVDSDGKCRFFVIDVDDYTGRTDIIKKIYKNDLPLKPFRSKSGGLHLYCFLERPESAKKIIATAKKFLPILGLPKSTEVFPKQAVVKENQIGSWINLPYFGGNESQQCIIDEEEKLITFSEAMFIIDKSKFQSIYIEEFLNEMELFDAPPCLQTIYYDKAPSSRNQYLFSLCRYLKAKHGDDFEHLIYKYNNELDEPLPTKEVLDTIVASHRKKDYSYRCEEAPLCDFCDKKTCKERQYGVGGDEVSELNFETFIQHTTDPPYYEWIINGKPMKFYSELDLINQFKFRELCFRELHVLPYKMKDNQWTKIINRALANVEVRKVQAHEDMSPGSILKEHLTDFFTNRALAEEKQQIAFDRVYRDEKFYTFRGKALTDYLFNYKNFKLFTVIQVQDRLKMMGAEAKRIYISKTLNSYRVWKLPIESLKEFMQEPLREEEFEVDFTKPTEGEKDETMY